MDLKLCHWDTARIGEKEPRKRFVGENERSNTSKKSGVGKRNYRNRTWNTNTKSYELEIERNRKKISAKQETKNINRR